MRAIDFAAIVSGLIAAAPMSAAADTFSFSFTYTFNNPSPLLGYINEDGSSFDEINPAAATLNSITLHAAANATWSGSAGTDFNEATYTITLGGFHFSMTAEKEGNGSAGAFIDFTDTTPADLSDFIGYGLVPTSVFVADTGGTAAFISSTFETETVTYNFTLPSAVPGEPIFPASPTLTFSVPEPSTWAMMLVGLAGLGFARLARRASQLLDPSVDDRAAPGRRRQYAEAGTLARAPSRSSGGVLDRKSREAPVAPPLSGLVRVART